MRYAAPLLAVLLPLTLAAGRAAPVVQPRTASVGTPDDLDPETRDLVIEKLAELIEETYIFPEIAKDIANHLRERHIGGAYDTVENVGTLASMLTMDLQKVNGDRHLNARPIDPKRLELPDDDPKEQQRRYLERMRQVNFGFEKVERMDGNVGYLDLRSFSDTTYASETAVAAMAFLANVDALIIDLRFNGGGSPSMVQLLTSYFFEEPTHLNSFELRGQKLIKQFWTLPHVPGKKLIDTPIFVLTSSRTFSAAEEFCYNLRNLERATLVGETTGGGAHPGGSHAVEGTISVFIPDGRAINPISGTNWEGTGVEPHIAVPAADALATAHAKARLAVRDIEMARKAAEGGE